MSNGSFTEDVDRLFRASEVREGAVSSTSGDLDWSTLDESVWATLRRDVDRVVSNTKAVLWPFRNERDPSKPLREWDLWGPLVFVLALGVTLSSDADDASTVFSIVFATVAFGAVALTLNVLLLGGHDGVHLGDRGGKRLLDNDVAAPSHGVAGHPLVHSRWGGDHDDVRGQGRRQIRPPG